MNDAQDLIGRAAGLLGGARRAVALTGAGFSRPSGIPDFRSSDGLWADIDPMEVASLRSFRRDPDRFYRWLNSLITPVLKALPNPAHQALARLEAVGKLGAVITQNIDGLHQRGGSRRVFELHGHLRGATCVECGRQVPGDMVPPAARRGRAPRCDCGGAFKPDVVLFDEGLAPGLLWLARKAVDECDLLIVAGTSLEVAPVCDLPLAALARGARLIVLNLSPTYIDERADVTIHADVAAALPAIAELALRAEHRNIATP
jgi:NAD-dependent deacetylase